MRLQLKQSWGREDSPAWRLFPLVPGLQRGAPRGPASPSGRAPPSLRAVGCRPGRRSGCLPARPGQWQHLPWPRPRSGAAGSPRPPPLRSRSRGRACGRGSRSRAGGRRCRARGAGRGAGGGARGVRGRGGVQLSLALLVVTARQAHIPSGSRSLSPFCFPTIELRWKQKIEGV